MPTNPPTIASRLSTAARANLYAVLGFLVPTTLVAIAVLKDGWQWDDLAFILPTAATSAGFPIARANVER